MGPKCEMGESSRVHPLQIPHQHQLSSSSLDPENHNEMDKKL